MEIVLIESRIDKIINLYFEKELEDTVLDDRYFHGSMKWNGIWKPNGKLIVGGPLYDKEWYYDTIYFKDGIILFKLTQNVFSVKLKQFIEKKYNDKIKIDRIL